MKYTLISYLFIFLFCESFAQVDSVKIIPLEFDRALNNPLKGFRPGFSTAKSGNHPYSSVVRTYLKWNELERNENDGIDQIIKVCNQKWIGAAAENIKIIPRVYLDWDGNEGNEYWPSDMTKGDYTSEEFKQRLTRLVKRLGKAWNNDPRVAWIQMGIIGYWGEHHHPAPNSWQQKLLGDLFREAFPNKHVLIRRPWETFPDSQFGWYWDSFAHWDQISSQADPMLAHCPDRWKVAPVEGETAYNWGNYKIQPGENPNKTLADPNHRKWLIQYIRKMHCTALGWVAGFDVYNQQVLDGAEEVQKAFGYRYNLKQISYPQSIETNEPFSVSFSVENVGSAPFYYNWPVELRLLDSNTHEVKWRQSFETSDIRSWMPGDQWNENQEKYNIPAPTVLNKDSFVISNNLSKGKYILALAILDPGGMTPSVKFATRQYFKGGNHPIGYIGIDTMIDQTILDPSIFDDPLNDNSLNYEAEFKLQSSFGGTNHKIPGLIEAENYDEGGEGVAYHDDGTKKGDASFRTDDNVDVYSNTKASNGYSVGATEEGEWLEYTVDVTAGKYDVDIYYFCGESPGNLVVSLNGNILKTTNDIQIRGWDELDSVQVNNVFLEKSSINNILRLEFINGAGINIDAIKFTKLSSPVSDVTLSNFPSDTLNVGDTFQLMVNVSPYYADNPALIWKSSDESVATVDSKGAVTTISEGTATITVTSAESGLSDSCKINVSVEIISVYGVTIGDCPLSILQAGSTHQLIANVAPMDASNRSVSWTSSKPEVATVDENGLVSAISQGSVKITVTTNEGGYSNSCNIGVMGNSTNADLPRSIFNAVKVYPNPASDQLFIEFPDSGSEKIIKIYNASGLLLKSNKTFLQNEIIDVSEMNAQALLVVKIITGQNVNSFKIIRQDYQ